MEYAGAELAKRDAAEAEVARLRAIIADVLASGVDHDDARIKYVTMQIDRATLRECSVALAGKEPPR